MDNGEEDNHAPKSLISALMKAEDGNKVPEISTTESHEPVEDSSLAGATTTGASTIISNASEKSNVSNYFMPHHRHSDSLSYSMTSSTNSLTNIGSAHSSSYLGSIVNSLGGQQAFPSSMFPGQTLKSPSSQQDIQAQQGGGNENNSSSSQSRVYPSYYYYCTSSNKDNNNNHRSIALPPSYQSTTVRSSNVYTKRRTRFCTDDDDDDDYDDSMRSSSWKSASRCFFSPRVLVTLAVCGVIIFNLLRLGEHHHHRVRRNGNSGKSSGIFAEPANSPEYVKLETIGGGSSSVSSNLSF